MARLGFSSRGLDVVKDDIQIAKVMDAYFHQQYVDYICEDAVMFLKRNTTSYDVCSSFSVFQWLYIQSDTNAVDQALKNFLLSTKHLLFFEMGYSAEAHYARRLPFTIDQEWVFDVLRNVGQFKNIKLIKAGERNLKRDFFIALRD